MTWRDVLTVLSTIDHRVARLSGDAKALSDEMREAKAGEAVNRWSREAFRIGQELAELLEVVERVKPEGDSAADTDVINVSAFASETCDDE